MGAKGAVEATASAVLNCGIGNGFLLSGGEGMGSGCSISSGK